MKVLNLSPKTSILRAARLVGAVALTFSVASCVGCEPTPEEDAGPEPEEDAGPEVTLDSLSVVPTSVTLDVGDTESLAVTAEYSDGSTELITTEGSFMTSDTAVATVNASGVVTAVGGGTADITVTFEGESATVAVTVNDDAMVDAGPGDAGPPDDAGPTDAGADDDAGPDDAGVDDDAGMNDAGPMANTFVVFGDQYENGVAFETFTGATNDITVDTTESQDGAASLKVEVPGSNYTGGSMYLPTATDLSGYDALTFWAKASQPATLNATGIQNDAEAGITTYQADRDNVALTTTWTKYAIPIPGPSKLTNESGMFYFAEGSEEGAYTIWFDLIQYETLGDGITSVTASIPDVDVTLGVGQTTSVGAPSVQYTVDIETDPIDITAKLASFDFMSSDMGAATVDAVGAIEAVAVGTAAITATLDGEPVTGQVDVTVQADLPDLVVFGDDYGAGVSFAGFDGSTNTPTIDTTEFQEGSASIRFPVPQADAYTGGAFVIGAPVDLSGYNAVTFWARADADNPVNVMGLGNTGQDDTYNAEINQVALTSTWTQFTLPIPDPSLLTSWSGLFHFAEGPEHGAYNIYFDDIRYTVIEDTSGWNPAPAIGGAARNEEVGETVATFGHAVTYQVDASPVTVVCRPIYFDYTSSDVNVATVDGTGVATTVALGTADITASLAGVTAAGALSLTVVPPPDTAAPTPTDTNVVSLYSDEYQPGNGVDTFAAGFSSATVSDYTVASDQSKRYTGLGFAGIEFFNSVPQVDATALDTLHIDVWNVNSPAFRVKLVDFGTATTEAEVTFNSGSSPVLETGQWQSLDIPLASFASLAARANLSQLIISADGGATVYVDNIYFYDSTP